MKKQKSRAEREGQTCPACKVEGVLAMNYEENLAYCFACGWHGKVPLRLVADAGA